MRFRSTYLLVAVLVLVVAGIVGQRWRQTYRQNTLQQRPTILAVADTGGIDRIAIRRASSTTELRREGAQWLIASAGNAPADPDAVQRLISALPQLRVRSVVATGDGDLAALGLAPERRIELTLSAGGAVLRQWWLGQPADYRSAAYVQEASGNTIYLAEPIPLDVFERDDWRDRTILRVPTEDIQEIKYQRGRAKFTLARQDGQWLLDGKPANQDAANSFAVNLANLNAVEFLPPDAEFKPLNITIGVALKDRQMELALGQAPVADEAYLKTSDGKLYLLANTNHTRLTKERKDFLP